MCPQGWQAVVIGKLVDNIEICRSNAHHVARALVNDVRMVVIRCFHLLRVARCVCVRACVRVRVRVCVCARACVRVCVCVCVDSIECLCGVYTHTHTHTHTL